MIENALINVAKKMLLDPLGVNYFTNNVTSLLNVIVQSSGIRLS